MLIELTLPPPDERRRGDPGALARGERVRGAVDAKVDELLRELAEPPA